MSCIKNTLAKKSQSNALNLTSARPSEAVRPVWPGGQNFGRNHYIKKNKNTHTHKHTNFVSFDMVMKSNLRYVLYHYHLSFISLVVFVQLAVFVSVCLDSCFQNAILKF